MPFPKRALLLLVLATTAAALLSPHAVQARGGPQGGPSSLPKGLSDNCVKKGNCGPAAAFVGAQMDRLERACLATNSLAAKKPFLNQLIAWSKVVDLLGLAHWDPGLNSTQSALCGGLLDHEKTYVELDPQTANLNPGDTLALKATIRCSNGTCTGTLNWASSSAAVATVDQGGSVTAVAGGHCAVVVKVAEVPEVDGTAQITVGAETANVAFVVDAGFWSFCEYYIDGDCDPGPVLADSAAEFRAALAEKFSSFQSHLISYSLNPSRVSQPTSYCGFAASAPCAAATTVGQEMFFESQFVTAFSSLRSACCLPNYFNGGTDYGSSMYSGLMAGMDAIIRANDAGLNAKINAIVLLGEEPACLNLIQGGTDVNCGVEPGSNISRDAVISRARSNHIQIYTVYKGGWRVGLGYNKDIEIQELQLLADSTGGMAYISDPGAEYFPTAPTQIVAALNQLGSLGATLLAADGEGYRRLGRAGTIAPALRARSGVCASGAKGTPSSRR